MGGTEDRILLEGLVFYGHHGVHAEERRLGQRFGVDLEVWVDLREAAATDDVAHTVDYGALYHRVRTVVEGDPVRLIETLADRIAEQILQHFGRVEAVRVRVRKPWAPIQGAAAGVAAVELTRQRAAG